MSADNPMPPPDVLEEFAKGCSACSVCVGRPCETCMAGGVCDGPMFLCRCNDDGWDDDTTDW